MSDFILEYDVLEDIAKYSNSLGRRAEEYGESLERKIIGAIHSVTGPTSGHLLNASDHIRDKINALNIKSKEFYQFSEQINKLLEVAEQMDQEVADAIMAQREYFLDHHESLRIEDWKAKLQGLLVELKNSIPLLEVIADVLDGLDTIFESLKDSIKHWYECEGGKYIIDVVKSVGGVALAVGFLALAIGALALPGAGFFAICGVIGAGIAVVNSVTNVATSFRAADAALDGDPAWARIYGKQDKLSDVLRQTNFGNGVFNQLSNFSAGAIDATEVICDVVGVAEMGKNVVKLFKGDAFKLLKNKGGISYSDLKNGVKNGIVDLKSTIKQSYKDIKYGIKGNADKNSLLGDMSVEDLKRYNKYWDEVAEGAYDIPYGMSAEEYYRHLKGVDKVDSVTEGVADPTYTSFRDLMSPDEVARYDKHWTGVAERISNEALDNQINFIKNDGITKPGGGAYKPAKISAAVDMNTGDIYFGYNGANKFNPSRNTLKPELQNLIDNTKSLAANDLSNPYAARNSYELWSVDNCAEVYATNNALRSGANIDNIFLNTKYFNNGAYAEPCANCKVTFKGFSMPNK